MTNASPKRLGLVPADIKWHRRCLWFDNAWVSGMTAQIGGIGGGEVQDFVQLSQFKTPDSWHKPQKDLSILLDTTVLWLELAVRSREHCFQIENLQPLELSRRCLNGTGKGSFVIAALA